MTVMRSRLSSACCFSRFRLLSQFLYFDVNISQAISYGEEVDHLERNQDEDRQKDCED